MASDFPKECAICEGDIMHIHDQHNARPVKEGYCCTLCNMEYVIPKRMGMKVIEIPKSVFDRKGSSDERVG